MRALLLLFLFGGTGLHRLYVGRWLGAVMLFTYTISTILVEVYFIYPSQSLSMEWKDTISLGFTLILIIIMISDLMRMGTWIDNVNSPKISEIYN